MTWKAPKTWIALACSATLSFSSSAALAQSNPPPAGGAGIFSLGSSSVYSTIIGLPLTTIGGVVLLIVLVANNSNSRALLQKHLQYTQAAG